MTEFKDGIRLATEFMAISARTAPKGKGEDFLDLKVLSSKKREELGKKMIKHGKKVDDPMWVRDGNCIREADGMLLIGTRDPLKEKRKGKGSGVDGDLFAESERIKRYIDLGIALGSAAKTASILNLDNRIMYRAGEMARRMGLLKALMVIGIPVSVSGKNIFFDR